MRPAEPENTVAPALSDADQVSGADGFLDADSWSALTRATKSEKFARYWLKLQCESLAAVSSAVIVLRDGRGEGRFSPAATWPPGAALGEAIGGIAEVALAEHRGIIKRSPDAADVWLAAYPILVDDEPVGVVALSTPESDQKRLAHIMRQLQWGTTWVESFYRRRYSASGGPLAQVLDMVAVALERREFRSAATSVVTELAKAMNCDRVSIGFRDNDQMKVSALSHSAEFGEKNNLIQSLAAAMDEAADQETVLHFPGDNAVDPHVLRAHAELSAGHSGEHICTVPLTDLDEVVGGITFERGQPFQRHEAEQLERLAALIGPILQIKRLEDRWLGAKIWAAAMDFRDRLFGPRYPGLKLSVALVAVVLLSLVFVRGEYRVSADAALEGIIQQSVTAPITGYISESNVRAGDIVEEGQLMASLDEKEFELERLRWVSQREKYRREYSHGLAEGDRGAVRVLAAQIEQADAQIGLLDEQLARTRIVTPFAGIIVSGDLSQSLSAPVERGDVLFKVAPLDSYRVILLVDERDIAVIKEGQAGQVALSGAPGDPLSFVVSKVTPVATAAEGQNRFRVEGELLGNSEILRPGMEGVAKVEVDERSLIWIYTHKLTHWLRVWLWKVLP